MHTASHLACQHHSDVVLVIYLLLQAALTEVLLLSLFQI
jgi:hypothetical protein